MRDKIINVLFLLAGLIISIFFYGLAVGLHQDATQAQAQVPQYQAECAGATWYSPATQQAPCYKAQAYGYLAPPHVSKSGTYFYTAEFTLPSGKVATARLPGSMIRLNSGSYVIEVWRSRITLVLINGQVMQTEENPVISAQGVGSFLMTGFVIVGTVTLMCVIFGSVILFGGSRERSCSQ